MTLPAGKTRAEVIKGQIEEAEESRKNAKEIVQEHMKHGAVKRIADLDFANVCVLKRTVTKKGPQLLRIPTVRPMMRILEVCADKDDAAAALDQLADELERIMKSDEQRANAKIKLPQFDKKRHIMLPLKF